jgi:hypothetical protein
MAELCKERSLRFLDCGIDNTKSHVQAIYPGLSETFDKITDYEDLSEVPLDCVIEQFPTHLDHCILWAVKEFSAIIQGLNIRNSNALITFFVINFFLITAKVGVLRDSHNLFFNTV